MNPSIRSIGASILFSFAVVAVFACTSESGETQVYRPTNTPIPLWKTVVDATLIPTVTPFPTPAPEPSRTPTATPTVTPSPSATPEPLTEREAYCRDHALPTSTPEHGETLIPVPTSPPGIADDEIPADWVEKMDEIEDWAREFYEVDGASVGELSRRFVEDDVWKEWRTDTVADWADEEDSTVHLWEQINRTLTLLSAESNYVKFIGDYQGEKYVGIYNPGKREIVIRSTTDEFDLGSELVYLHEYSHHIQNEKYDLTGWLDCLKNDDDAIGAYRALFEGDASNTEYEYIENVIGWDQLQRYSEGSEQNYGDAGTETVMKRYLDEVNDFTYSSGVVFVWAVGEYLHEFMECLNCETARQRIDEAFKRPPLTTEQIYDPLKYFDKERRYTIGLPEDFMGADWEVRRGSTVGKSDWGVLLAALTGEEGDELQTQVPEWDGDYGMLFEDKNGRALYVQVVRWRGDGYINRLADVFDADSRLTRRLPAPPSDNVAFADYYVWDGDSGSIAMGIESVSGWHYTMFLAVGPDVESVEKAVFAARDHVTLDGKIMFPNTSAALSP